MTNVRNNVVVQCPTCRVTYDAAPSSHRDVIINTEGGRLRVRQVVKAVRDLKHAVEESSASDIVELQRAVQRRMVRSLALVLSVTSAIVYSGIEGGAGDLLTRGRAVGVP